ncbi:solute carrier organic anion transporter family member 5A1 [Trichonephila clavipes]|uniref:Solute carrier organic anion transporter family member 5A1 n=1 Tax=Trichonephila clavipes TaxID=2585209 RepID=A0A8X6VKM4_TRICX|nr:solute carrier organic anion transporter family member 5A1 [Trichonephila clavipes]
MASAFSDLNPIENVWDALGRQVAGRKYLLTNKNTLIRALTEEWDKLPQQLLDNVVQSPPGIIAIMLSTLLGGYVIWKYKPNVKSQIATMIILESISAAGYLLLMIPHCDKVEMSHFGLENYGLALEGQCNFNCNCTTKVFTPLCGSDGKTSYFSPCFAGCTENLNKSFSDCSCILDPDGQRTNSYAKEGFCVSLGCWSQALGYIISLPILQFIASILRVQYTVILVRSINPEDKSIALGLFEALICIFGFIPYLSAFGALVDSSCLIWEKVAERQEIAGFMILTSSTLYFM